MPTTLQEDRAELVAQIQQATRNLLACQDERTAKEMDAEVTLMRNELFHLDRRIKDEAAAKVRRKREEFAKRQNCESIRIKSSFVFQNAAVVWADGHYTEPPEDEIVRTRIQRDFYSAKLEQVQKEAKRIRRNVSIQAGYQAANCGNSPDVQMPGWEDRLAELDSEIAELGEKLAECEAALPPTPNEIYWRDRNEQGQQAREALARLNNPGVQP